MEDFTELVAEKKSESPGQKLITAGRHSWEEIGKVWEVMEEENQEAAVRELLGLLKTTEDHGVRDIAAMFFGDLKEQDAAVILAGLLTDPRTKNHRGRLVAALGDLDYQEFLPVIEGLASPDESFEVRSIVQYLLHLPLVSPPVQVEEVVMAHDPLNATEAIAMAVLAFLPKADDARLRDTMERHFFEPAPRKVIARLNPPEELREALDLCAELDDVWDLGTDVQRQSIEDIRRLLVGLIGKGPCHEITLDDCAVFIEVIRREEEHHPLPAEVQEPLRRRLVGEPR
jgi:hypothetical protein